MQRIIWLENDSLWSHAQVCLAPRPMLSPLYDNVSLSHVFWTPFVVIFSCLDGLHTWTSPKAGLTSLAVHVNTRPNSNHLFNKRLLLLG